MGTLVHPKTVRMFRNGDMFFPARSVVVNTHVTRNWDAFLDRVTQGVRPQRGAIRLIYDADTGKKVKTFEDLEDGKSYVAAGLERFKRIPYSNIQDQRTRERTMMQKHKTTLSSVQRVIRSGRAKKLGAGVRGKTIYVTMNGDLQFKPIKVLVNNRTTPDIEHLYDEIGKKVKAYTVETITKVYDINGRRIRSLDGVSDGGQYVAVTRGRFKALPYFSPVPISQSSPAKMAIKLRSDLRYQKNKKYKKNGSPTKLAPMGAYQNGNSKAASNNASPVKPAKKPQQAQSPVQAKPSPPKKLAPAEKVQSYNVTVVTGSDASHATDANVYLTIHGSKGDTRREPLREDSDNFDAGNEDVFAVESKSIGDITAITLEQDDSGASSAWFVERVTVRDTVTNKRIVFEVHDWLATDRGNMTNKIRVEADGSHKKKKKKANGAVRDEMAAPTREQADAVEDTADTMEDRPVKEARAAVVDDDDVDDTPSISTGKFQGAEKEIKAALQDPQQLKAFWRQLDFNGNNIVSLAEIDKFVVERFPVLNNKPALMRAYKKTTLRDGDGDSWVEKKEFPALLSNLLYFNCLFDAFDDIDTDDDRRVDFEEFKKGLKVLDMKMGEQDARDEFALMDENGGGVVLFDEFAAWAAQSACPVNDVVMTEFTTSDDKI
ncbi:hypothetical protein PTSG_11815 [Salpingoeca rosetta]|uniref:Calmodulin n=1 Tax=Salpingoeca rosetta (strain ATCC 50818 / BSB-021) TaxID=946362 RepID=F2TZI2_SALR5|nr:uncharacterized protein PTSG_11815 [Salpingoeca rosetta]EGD79006.1 hypothetical protein PTSG_11815 [Salpingoeca rosetta]|eukprot:XP_004997962.1 hypothetical protein PTSG_11815 [Salpingoeca rosetta]